MINFIFYVLRMSFNFYNISNNLKIINIFYLLKLMKQLMWIHIAFFCFNVKKGLKLVYNVFLTRNNKKKFSSVHHFHLKK